MRLFIHRLVGTTASVLWNLFRWTVYIVVAVVLLRLLINVLLGR